MESLAFPCKPTEPNGYHECESTETTLAAGDSDCLLHLMCITLIVPGDFNEFSSRTERKKTHTTHMNNAFSFTNR